MSNSLKIDGIKGIAFDLDGTLYPNYKFNLMLIPFIFQEFRLLSAFGKARNIIRKKQESPEFTPIPNDDFYIYQAKITANLLKEDFEKVKEKIDRLIYKGWEPFFKKIDLFKNAIETLKAFKKAGLKLALLSDFPPETKLEYLGLGGLWDTVLSSERCGALKPHPLPFIQTASSLSLQPEEMIYVGNSRIYDITGAYRAGMKTAWIKPALFPGKGLRKPKADFVFTNYRNLQDFML